MPEIIIAGGGIGGLAAALGCARAGARVQLFERAPEFSEVGAGIQLGPNVTRILLAWGLQDALARVAAFPQKIQFCSAQSASVLGELALGAEIRQKYGAPYVAIHRADIHELLLQAVREQTDASLRLNAEVTGLLQSETRVSARLADGEQAQADLLVAADGAWSVLRQQVLHDGKPIPTGHLAYRAMVRQADLPQALRSQQVTAWLGPRMHVVQYPVRGGDWLNVVAIVHGTVQGDMSSWDHSANAQDLRRILQGAHRRLRDLVAAIDHWRLWPLSIRPPMQGPQEHALGRVALLGDAAHPMVPYLAQGAAMAIEDAFTLAGVLQAAGAQAAQNAPHLLRDYALRRWERNAQVQARAVQNGEIYHLTGPMRLGRDLALRLLGKRLLDQPWLYGGLHPHG